jgi:hypothetical protein
MTKSIHSPAWLVYGVTVALWIYTYIDHMNSLSSGAPVNREYGLIENATAFFLFLAIIFFILCLKKSQSLGEKMWLLILIVGSVYFLGEEISWGYHFFHYDVGEKWSSVNEQKEPNLHNLGAIWGIIFKELPRQLVSIAVVIGGLLGVVADRTESWPKNTSLRQLIPSGDTLFVAIIANVVSAPEKIFTHILTKAQTPKWLLLGNDAGELKECLLALFIMLYAYKFFRNLNISSDDIHETLSITFKK